MKVIIAGSRSIHDYNFVESILDKYSEFITEVVSGCAEGVDSLALIWAIKKGIATKSFPANWKQYPKYAGILRNKEMAKYADHLVAIWDGESKGTANMIRQMHDSSKSYQVILYGKELS